MKLSQFIIVVNNITSTIENNVMAKYKLCGYPKICISSIGMIVDWAEVSWVILSKDNLLQ